MKLYELVQDKESMEQMEKYLHQFLREEVIDRAFDHMPIDGVVLAKEVIEKAFLELELKFSRKEEQKEINNPAR